MTEAETRKQYVLRIPDSAGDFTETIDAESAKNALNAAYTHSWPDLGGRTEVYDADDVPATEEYYREEFPVGDAEPVLVVDVGRVVETRPYEVVEGEDEGEKREFKVGKGF